MKTFLEEDPRLGDYNNLLEKLSWERVTYYNNLKTILDILTDQELQDLIDLKENEENKFFFTEVSIIGAYYEGNEMHLWKKLAQDILKWRLIDRKADEVMNLPDSSGVFCVYHSCDMKDCRSQHE